MSRNPKPIAAAVAVVLALSVGGYYAYKHVNGDAANAFYGSVDVRDVSIGFRVSGRVTEVLVDEGSAVKSGDVLARLDAEPYRRMRDENLGARDAAAARLAFLQKGYNTELVAKAKAQLDEARVALANADKAYKRAGGLRASGASSQSTLDNAQATYEEAAARVRAVEQEYAQLRKGYREEEIAEARANLAKAEASYARAQLQIDDAELKAPADGVVQTRAIEPGSMVAAGNAALVIAKNNEAWVRAYVAETDLGRAVPGARVSVYTDSRPDKPYAGRIGSVSPRAEFTPRTVETTDLRTSLVYRVRVLIDEPDPALRQGMPVTVRFEEGSR